MSRENLGKGLVWVAGVTIAGILIVFGCAGCEPLGNNPDNDEETTITIDNGEGGTVIVQNNGGDATAAGDDQTAAGEKK